MCVERTVNSKNKTFYVRTGEAPRLPDPDDPLLHSDGVECIDAALGDLRILNSLRATILSIRFFIRGSDACRRGNTKTSSFIPPSTFYSQ